MKKKQTNKKKLSNLELITILTFENYLETYNFFFRTFGRLFFLIIIFRSKTLPRYETIEQLIFAILFSSQANISYISCPFPSRAPFCLVHHSPWRKGRNDECRCQVWKKLLTILVSIIRWFRVQVFVDHFHGKSILESLDRRNFDNARAICNLHSRYKFALA